MTGFAFVEAASPIPIVGVFEAGRVSGGNEPLTVNVAAVKVSISGVHYTLVAQNEVAVAASSTNYIFVDDAGTLQVNATGYPGSPHVRLARVVTDGVAIRRAIDDRELLSDASTPSIGYTLVQSGGAPLAQRGTLNFQGALTATDDAANLRTNVVVDTGEVLVNTLADLPAPSGSDIILDPVAYRIVAPIDLGSNRLVWTAGTYMSGVPNAAVLTSNNATEVIRAVNAPLDIIGVTIQQTGPGNAILIQDDTGLNHGLSTVTLQGNVRVTGTSVALFIMFNSSFVSGGLRLAGQIANCVLDRSVFALLGAGTVGIDILLGAVVVGFVLERSLFVFGDPTAIGVRVDAADQVGRGIVDVVDFGNPPVGTPTSGFDQASDTWLVSRCLGLPDSADRGSAAFSSTATTIDLPGGQAWADLDDGGVAIVWSPSADREKFDLVPVTGSNNGELRYSGPQGSGFLVSGSVVFQRTAGADILVQFGVAVEGVIVATTVVRATATNVARTVVLPAASVTLTPGTLTDVKLQARNIDGGSPTADIDVFEGLINVMRLG